MNIHCSVYLEIESQFSCNGKYVDPEPKNDMYYILCLYTQGQAVSSLFCMNTSVVHVPD
jgi:hypothetical protein